MHSTYRHPVYEYIQSAEQRSGRSVRHPVVIVGAGPVGLCAAVDLAQNHVPVVLLDDDNTSSTGSRAICFAKRTLEILDRLGVGQTLVAKGVTWNIGKVFFGEQQLYEFNLSPEDHHQRPAFINLQQYYLEDYLVARLLELELAEVRWQHKVIALEARADGVAIDVETVDGVFGMQCDYLIACDGSRSPIREALQLEFKGQQFQDRFLIADVVMKGDYPAERWFWFEPPFFSGQSTLLHKQPDDIWRIDFQLGWDADPVAERKPENVLPKVRAMLGDRPFELEWVSVYTFSCMRLDKFRHGRVIFAGDAAHIVSPFGARGANGGIQDVDNLIWKLRLVLDGKAPETLLDSYDTERLYASDENIKNSTRATDFITPKTPVSKTFRDAVLGLAADYPFARALVNSGRLSVPAVLDCSPLNTPDSEGFSPAMRPGTVCIDAPVSLDRQPAWLLPQLGNEFCLLIFYTAEIVEQTAALAQLRRAQIPLKIIIICEQSLTLAVEALLLVDTLGLVATRYDARPGTCYLIRPDQHVAARWQAFDSDRVRRALARASAREAPG